MIRVIYDKIQTLLIGLALMFVGCIGGAWILLDISPHIVMSGSMEPAIPTGSLCFVDEQSRYIKTGDVIAFEKGGMKMTHRVAGRRTDGGYITKGDNNTAEDPAPVYQKDIIGKTIFWIPKLGYGAAFLRSIQGILSSLIFLTAFILLDRILPQRKRKGDLYGKSRG